MSPSSHGGAAHDRIAYRTACTNQSLYDNERSSTVCCWFPCYSFDSEDDWFYIDSDRGQLRRSLAHLAVWYKES